MGGGFVSVMARIAVLAGIVSFFASGLMWYFYFYRKEKKMLQRLYDVIEWAEGCSASKEADTACMSGDRDTDELKKKASETDSEEKVSMIEDKFRRFVNGCLLENENNRQQKQVIQGLISDISHQTLTPISNLKLYAELLQELVCNRTGFDDAVDSELSEVMDTLYGQTEKLDFLIQSLVMLSRMETGLIGVHVQAGNIQSLFDIVHREYRKKASEKG